MRGEESMGDFRFFRPESMAQLLEHKKKEGRRAHILDGGSNVLVYVKEGSIEGGTLVDVRRLKALKGIAVKNGQVEIGAGEVIADILASPVIRRQARFFAEALQQFANPLVRNMATLAGNIADSSPIGDTIPPLLVLEAKVVAASRQGRRAIPLDEFFSGPGANVLKASEVITKIRFPVPGKGRGEFLKFGLRRGTSCSVASVAVWVRAAAGKIEEARIALGGVAPTPLRARITEGMLKGQRLDAETVESIAGRVQHEISPISDVRASAEYRLQVTGHLLAKALRRALGLEE
jgi:carbon-monoxide dehydrogenase medium subunit